jgi:membrane-associated phospholipid phosphatase
VEADTQTRQDLERQSELWHEAAPRHFDHNVAWWIKAILIVIATIIAIHFIDAPVARWALSFRPIDLKGGWGFRSDIVRELAMLEQWGQWVCSVLVITAIALIDKAGPRRALAIAIGCFATVMLTYLLKDLCGRSRPHSFDVPGVKVPMGEWIWGGPAKGFGGGSTWASFPSAHTTGAFALSVGLAWFYPRARGLFMTLATITAVQRVLHGAHFVSDVIAGLGISVLVTRSMFQAKLAGRAIALMPTPIKNFYLKDWNR